MNYRIHNSLTGEVIISSIELEENEVEYLSSDAPEGHFRAGDIDELVEAGINPEVSVYAIVL